MITVKPTDKLTGVTIRGDYLDFSYLVESIYNLTSAGNDERSPYYSVAIRTLGICYDIRHAYQGDREIELVDNGMHAEIMKWHSLITPEQNVYYSVNILFPEALFVALAVKDLYLYAGIRAEKSETDEWQQPYSRAAYLRDIANLDQLAAGILEAFTEVIGQEDADKVIRLYQRTDQSYYQYASQYIDKLNLEYLKTIFDKRKDKLRNIAKRIIEKPTAYYKLEADLKYWAKEYKTSIHELHDPKLQYPEEIEW